MDTYEKKYKEALERARDVYTYYCDDREQLRKIESIFPELKESEDERIRQDCIKYLNWEYQHCSINEDKIKIEKCIAWLERLGDKAFSVERLFAEAGIKPAYKDGDSWCVLIGENIQEGICGFGETPRHAYVNFLKELWGKAFEQKTSEWSEDDNAKIEFLCNLIKRNISEGTYSFGDGAKNGFVSKQEAIKMLQSLKSRVQPQPKQEWSEEDEGIVSRIMTDLENCESEWGSDKKEEKDWLESLKERYTWKPSDEQMEALRYVTNFDYGGHKATLVSLYEQLKKLKG